MTVRVDLTGIRDTTWREYGVRFLAGGAITVIAGLIARKWGLGIGGLFLAFPAIFPASAILVEKHERERKEKKGLHGEKRGATAAAADAAGAAMGSLGLIVFAIFCRAFISRHGAAWVLPGAAITWAVVSVAAWFIRRRWKRSVLWIF